MARRLTRDENTAVTKRRLLRAARQVILERGFHGATLEVVAERAGFTKGAVYSRFDSKADLYFALLEELNEERTLSIEESIAGAQSRDEVVEALKRWFSGHRVKGNASPTLVLVEFWSWAARDPALRARASAVHERMLVRIADVVDEALERCDAELPYATVDLVRLVAGLARGITLERHISPDLVDDGLVDWMFDSLAPADGDRSEAENAAVGVSFGRQ
jgi:AcrR family transcriptional regulator